MPHSCSPPVSPLFPPFPGPARLSPWVPAFPPLEGGAWLHPRVLELYAPSRQGSWGEWHPAGGSGREQHHDRQENLHCRLWQLVSSSVKECVGGQRGGLPRVFGSQGGRLGEQEVLWLPLLSLAYPTRTEGAPTPPGPCLSAVAPVPHRKGASRGLPA